MASSITNITSHVEVDQVTSIVVSTSATDPADGKPVRTIRVYGQPSGTLGAAVFELTLKADSTLAQILISAPTLTF